MKFSLNDAPTDDFAVPDPGRWTLPEILETRAQEHPGRPFFQMENRDPWTYGRINSQVNRLAHGLRAMGCGSGDSVLIMLPNCTEFVLGWFAANKLGACQVPVNTAHKGSFLSHVIRTSRAEMMIVADSFLDRVEEIESELDHLKTLVVVPVEDVDWPRFHSLEVVRFGEVPVDRDDNPGLELSPRDIAAIHFTSGTTGRAKGSMMTHAQAHLMTEINVRLLELDGDDVSHTPLPFFHVNAQLIAVYSCLLVGAKVVVYPEFSASRWLQQIRESEATTTTLLGVMLEFVLNQSWENESDNQLETIWAVPNPPDLSEEFKHRFGVKEMKQVYGNTEIGIVCMPRTDSLPEGSCGQLIDEWYEARIVDPETHEPLGPNQVGEFVVRPRVPWIVSQGYLNMPEATVEAYRNLWFHTGDALKRDEDDNYYFMDRIRDRIRRRGENISSTEIEQTLLGHERVREVAVVPVESEIRGGEDEIKVVMVPEKDSRIDYDSFVRWCAERLPDFAIPRYLEIRSDLPKTPTNKVIKTKLEDITDRTWDREQDDVTS